MFVHLLCTALLASTAADDAKDDAKPDADKAVADSAVADSAEADAARAPARRKDDDDRKPRARAPAHEREHNPRKQAHGPVAIPIDIGVGPVVMLPNPPAFQAQPIFTGLEISLAAVINKQLIDEHKDQIPANMRGIARGINEVKIRPWFLALIPERLIISPQIASLGANTGMYGAVWRPLGAGIDLVNTKSFDISVDGAVDVAAIFIHSSKLGGGTEAANSITVFLRPGINLALTGELALSESLLLTGGWSSDLFVPQPFGKSPLEIEPLDNSLWHLGGPFIALHVRIPYEVNL